MPTLNSNDLVVNQQISSDEPLLTISIDTSQPLRSGSYQFQLVVTDDSGNNSQPATTRIIIVDDQAPTAVIDAPNSVGFAQDFALSGKRSIDVGGKIIKYVWTLIDTP